MAEEKSIAERSHISPSSLETTSVYLRMPENVQGMKILDIGSGPSTMVNELTRKGAQAVDVDYNYRDMKGLKRAADKFINHPDFQGSHKQALRNAMRKVKDTFFGQLDAGKKPYIAGLAGELPFADDTFNLAYSSGCISTLLINDAEILRKSILEGVRVIKPGKTLQIAPWNIPDLTEDAQMNASIALQILKKRNIPFTIEEVPGRQASRLIITKPLDTTDSNTG